VHTLQLLSSKSTVVFRLVVSWPHSPRSSAQIEARLSFTEAVDAPSWNCHIDLNELILEDESAASRINQRLTGPRALELESERVRLEMEANGIKSELVLAGLLGNDVIRDVEALRIIVVCER